MRRSAGYRWYTIPNITTVLAVEVSTMFLDDIPLMEYVQDLLCGEGVQDQPDVEETPAAPPACGVSVVTPSSAARRPR